MDRTYRIAYWSLAPVVCIVLYWYGLKAWFQMDDFAWLNLHSLVYDWPSFLDTMFRPMAQGTVRPISERLFFFSFWHWFGMEALPYRVLVFLTQFGNLTLITLIVRRLSGSEMAGLLAPLLWLACPAIYESMAWTSAYNQILCSFALLLQFYLFIRFTDTKRSAFYAGMWITFLLGFGVLELNVVAPAILTLYALLYARKYWLHVAPMFVVSLAYAIWHRHAGRTIQTDIYAMDFRPSTILADLYQYVWLTISAFPMSSVSNIQRQQLLNLGFIVLVAIAACVVWRLRKRDWLPLLFIGWYLIAIGPYLPLGNHVSDYYLTVPSIGIAMLMAWGAAAAWHSGTLARGIAVAALAAYAIPCSWQANYLTKEFYLRSKAVRDVVRSAAYAHRLHPDKLILLKGVTNDLFWTGIYDRPQRALGWRDLYLTGDTETSIAPFPGRDLSDRFLSERVTLDAIRQGRAVIYDVTQFPVRNITELYSQMLLQRGELPLPSSIQPGLPLFADYMKEGWFDMEAGNDFRWTTSRATATIRGPRSEKGSLSIAGVVARQHTAQESLAVRVSVNGVSIGERTIPQGVTDFLLTYELPASLAGKPSIMVTIEPARTILVPPDDRALGLLVGSIEVKP